MNEFPSLSVNDDVDAGTGAADADDDDRQFAKRPKVDCDYDPEHDFLRPSSSCPRCTSKAEGKRGCDDCYNEKERNTWFIEWNDLIRQTRETVVERTKTNRILEHCIYTACNFDEVNIARLVMEYFSEKIGDPIVSIDSKGWGAPRQQHEAFIDFINTYRDDTLSHIPVQVTYHLDGYKSYTLPFHVTSLVNAMLSSAQHQSYVTFSLNGISAVRSVFEICTDFLASEMLKATPASRAVFGSLNCLNGLHTCGKRFFEAVQAGLAPNLTCLTGQEYGYALIDEDADFPCLIETIKSEFCAFKELELPTNISWNAEKASLLINALRSPNCKLEMLSDKFSLFEKSKDEYDEINVNEACLQLSRKFGVPAE
jgi:hypothetical protein